MNLYNEIKEKISLVRAYLSQRLSRTDRFLLVLFALTWWFLLHMYLAGYTG